MPGILNLTLRLDESDESPELQVVRMNGREAISELFWFELDVVASAGNALPEELTAVLGADDSKSGPNQNLMFYLTLRHGILAVEARLLWCAEAVDALDALDAGGSVDALTKKTERSAARKRKRS